MKRLALIVVVLVAAGVIARAQGPRSPEIMFKTAQHTEQVQGDLRTAIKQYEQVVASGNRSLAAQALVHMAECHQKLGDAEARTVYQRILRDYADQADATATARARLGASETVAGVRGDRAVWTGHAVDMFGQVSPDGRFISYVDWTDTGNVMFHDVANNTDHRVTPKTTWKESGQQGGYSAISRDGKQIAYFWETWGAFEDNGPVRRAIYVAPLQESGHLRARRLFETTEDVSYLDPYDWSPDGKWIALAIEKRQEGIVQIAIASTAGGSVRVLKTVNWRGPGRIFFSPDGRYIAYDLSASDTTDDSHVFVMAVDGTRETEVVAHQSRNWPVGWPADGSRLFFASDRTGSVGLWSVPIADGRTRGAAEIVKADIGSVYPLGMTPSGTAYVFKSVGDRDVHVASIDLDAANLTAPAAALAQGFVEGATTPDWSPDGKFLAYAACDGHCIAIRSIETGQVRRLRAMYYARFPHWSPDSGSLIVVGRDLKGRQGIFQVDVHTGQPALVVQGANSAASPRYSADGKRIFWVPRGDHVLRERHLSTGTERDVFRDPRLREGIYLSPDGGAFAVTTNVDPTTRTSKVLLVPVNGGTPRELFRLTVPEGFSEVRCVAWTPDGKALLIQKATVDPVTFLPTVEGHSELWKVSVSTGESHKMNIDVDAWIRGNLAPNELGFTLSPDGRRIAFLMGKHGYEVWALENVVPRQTARK